MLLLSLILAHLIADFYLQTDKMVKNKLKHLKRHIFHHLLTFVVPIVIHWIINFNPGDILEKVLLPIGVILILHTLIDIVKIKVIDNNFEGKAEKNILYLICFLADQLLHLLTIIMVSTIFYDYSIQGIVNRVAALIQNQENAELSLLSIVLLLVIIFILTTTVSGHIVRILLGTLPNQLATFEGKYSLVNELKNKGENTSKEHRLIEEYNYLVLNKHDLSRGLLIGYLERLIVVILTYYSAYPAIAFIVTAKSITRFKQMDERNWAEYFLLGTLTSMLLGILIGTLFRLLVTP